MTATPRGPSAEATPCSAVLTLHSVAAASQWKYSVSPLCAAGYGSCFTIKLPFACSDADPAAPPFPADAAVAADAPTREGWAPTLPPIPPTPPPTRSQYSSVQNLSITPSSDEESLGASTLPAQTAPPSATGSFASGFSEAPPRAAAAGSGACWRGAAAAVVCLRGAVLSATVAATLSEVGIHSSTLEFPETGGGAIPGISAAACGASSEGLGAFVSGGSGRREAAAAEERAGEGTGSSGTAGMWEAASSLLPEDSACRPRGPAAPADAAAEAVVARAGDARRWASADPGAPSPSAPSGQERLQADEEQQRSSGAPRRAAAAGTANGGGTSAGGAAAGPLVVAIVDSSVVPPLLRRVRVTQQGTGCAHVACKSFVCHGIREQIGDELFYQLSACSLLTGHPGAASPTPAHAAPSTCGRHRCRCHRLPSAAPSARCGPRGLRVRHQGARRLAASWRCGCSRGARSPPRLT